MAVKITQCQKHSKAFRKGLRAGCVLKSINGNEINDVLDYQFYIKETMLKIDFQNEKGKDKSITIKKDEFDDLGLDFETYLMDKQHRCSNGCIFCFIDQMPKGMRESLYFKDDDSRLSFLFGNYITLTNLSEHDAQRIIKMHISPVNISVHTMNPELRVSMMKNKNAGKSLEFLKRFAEAGIKINTQLVLCPGINDGKELEFSLRELSALYPSVQSIAAVPVGVTKFRQKLYPLEEYTPQGAKEVIDIVTSFGDEFAKTHSTRLAFCADEFYLKAGLEMPSEDYYEDYPQIENGVGLCKSLETEFFDALSQFSVDSCKRSVSLATGVASYPLLKSLCDAACKKIQGLKINVFEIQNDFFGHSITVAGLITGQDLIAQLKGKPLGDELLIPSVMLKTDEDIFLDDITLKQAEEELEIKIKKCDNDGYNLLNMLVGN